MMGSIGKVTEYGVLPLGARVLAERGGREHYLVPDGTLLASPVYSRCRGGLPRYEGAYGHWIEREWADGLRQGMGEPVPF